MEFKKLSPFGVEVLDFNIRSATPAEFDRLTEAFKEHSVILLNDPKMTEGEHISLMSRFGPVAREVPGAGVVGYIAHDPSTPLPSGSAGGKGFGEGELAFHFDMSYTMDWPQWIPSLYGVKVPSVGGETMFIHCGRIHDKLDDPIKEEIAHRKAVHIFNQAARSNKTREADVGPYALRSVHPVVMKHPYRDQGILTVMDADTDRIVGMAPDKSEKLLQKLFDALADPKEILKIKWRVGDLVIWDNRVVQHARAEFDPKEARILRRVGVGDEKGILNQMQTRMDIFAPAID